MTQASADLGINQGLIQSLLRPYWRETAAGWEFFFRHQFFMGSFNVAKRDEVVAAIGRTVDKSSHRSQIRLLILEHVGQNGQFGLYERAAVATGLTSDADAKELSAQGVVVIGHERWQPIQQNAEVMLKAGGRNPGYTYMYDGTDATILSYFDGKAWRIETWFFITDLDAGGSATVPRDVLAYASLLRHLNANLKQKIAVPAEEALRELLGND